MPNITPTQALTNLFQAAQLASMSAKDHQVVIESFKILDAIINPPAKVETPEPKE